MTTGCFTREDIMKKLSLAFLAAWARVLTSTPIMSAYAQVQLPAQIKFKGYALGRCLVMKPARALKWRKESDRK